jgi:hypothetical protein
MRAVLSVRRRCFAMCLPLAALLAGCGGSTEPAVSPETPQSSEQSEAKTPPAEEASKPEDKKPEIETSSEVTEQPQEATEENTGRDIKYVATTEGLRVDVAGMRFMATATAVQKAGTWSVKINVEAQAADSKPHSVLSPKNGPLAFGGLVQRKGQSEAEQFGDKREGETEVKVAPGKITNFKREWPSKGQKPLATGDVLELHVGLWGIGDDASSRRPVKQFFRVKLNTEKERPRAIVEPPPSAGEG